MTSPTFRVPVEGRLLVIHGGLDTDGNHHVHPQVPQQRHAYDLLGIDEDGNAIHPGHDGDRNEEWVGFGMRVVAPADGTVVEAEDRWVDHPPQTEAPDGDHAAGNHVVLRHDDGSFTWIAHLQQGSVRRDLLGSRVVAGTPLGLLGNSGNSTGPHLHVHRQAGSVDLYDPSATGVEIAFTGARLVGSFDFAPDTGFTNWKPATTQPSSPRVARRGDVLAHD